MKKAKKKAAKVSATPALGPERDERGWAKAAFPEPGAKPKVYTPRDEQDHARLQNELYEWQMRAWIYRAVHINDPHARDILSFHVGVHLNQGFQLTTDERRWLSWLLRRLRESDAIPHMARGNTTKDRERTEFMKKLVHVIAGLGDGPITSRLKKAARSMGVSYEKARKAYYSDSFRFWELSTPSPPPINRKKRQ